MRETVVQMCERIFVDVKEAICGSPSVPFEARMKKAEDSAVRLKVVLLEETEMTEQECTEAVMGIVTGEIGCQEILKACHGKTY